MKYQYLPIYAGFVALTSSFMLGYTPLLLSCIFLLASIVTYINYSIDKYEAIKGRRRVSETALHFGALLCGWPGAIIGQEFLRHKTKKVKFRIVFWMTVVSNCGLMVWLHTTQGMVFFRDGVSMVEKLLLKLLGPGQASEIVLLLTRNHT